MTPLRTLACGTLFFAIACASAAPQPAGNVVHVAGPARGAAPPDTLAVSGLRGTLSQAEIRGTLEPKLPKLLRCVQQRRGELEALAGRITLAFHVATNGAVASVQPNESTLGDRATERCLLQIAESARFPAPHGGEADLTWPLDVPGDEEVRPPVELGADPAHSLGAALGALGARCGGGQVVVTAYIDPDGHVLAAGAASPDIASPTQLDCVSEGVRELRFPSPGSYLGKTSFTIP